MRNIWKLFVILASVSQFTVIQCAQNISETVSSPLELAITTLEVNSSDNAHNLLCQHIEESRYWKTSPCDNFLHYACGNWPYFLESEVPDTLHIMDAKLNEEFRKIFQQRNPRLPEMNFMRQARNYYESCTGMFGEMKPLNPVEYLKWLQYNENMQWMEWGDEENKNAEQNVNWLKMLAIFRKYGLNNFIMLEGAMQHPWNNTKMILAIKRPFADNPYHYLGSLENEQRKFTLRNISDTADYQKYLEFDLELKKLVDYHRNLTSRQAQLVTLEQLKHLQLQWLEEYLNVALQPIQIPPEMEIFIEDMDYLKTTKLYLDEVEDPKFLARYLQLNFLSQLSYSHADHIYYDCMQSTRHLFPLVMQWLYKHHHPEISYEFYKLQLLFSNLKRNLKKQFNRQLEDAALELAKNKLNNLKLQIIDVWQPAIEHLYSDVWLDPFDFVGNRLKLQHKQVQIDHSHLGDVVKRGALEFLNLQRADIANSLLPFSISRQNLIVLPVTALQFPFYHPQLKHVFIYSSLGYLMAREIVKQFTDPQLQQIDANGNLNSRLKEHFINITIADDYSYKLNVVALELAYETLSVIQALGREDVKLFLLRFANSYCGNYIKFGDHLQMVNSVFRRFSSRRWNVFGCNYN
ncbi:neprilysin-21-like [Musca vetustissima]|uniref:neprilysin-21-like n=1 Tax=Musca vetustissima TaxID=27455 RepID=UPI002AB64D39|nr:neprilysin-21-like [Musca vetustissima]